jgi:hypothetical protein
MNMSYNVTATQYPSWTISPSPSVSSPASITQTYVAHYISPVYSLTASQTPVPSFSPTPLSPQQQIASQVSYQGWIGILCAIICIFVCSFSQNINNYIEAKREKAWRKQLQQQVSANLQMNYARNPVRDVIASNV